MQATQSRPEAMPQLRPTEQRRPLLSDTWPLAGAPIALVTARTGINPVLRGSNQKKRSLCKIPFPECTNYTQQNKISACPAISLASRAVSYPAQQNGSVLCALTPSALRRGEAGAAHLREGSVLSWEAEISARARLAPGFQPV